MLSIRSCRRVRTVLGLLAALSIAPTVHAQMMGSTESGAVTPREVKAHELQATVLQGDVDLFTGRYSASYPLGEVSTGGLSFALSLQYSPTVVGSTTPTLTEGVPYGVGWSPSIPTISVSTTTRHAYSGSQEQAIDAGGGSATDPLTKEHLGWDEGRGYWYAPVVNIPGVASGRAVFQRFERSEAVFVLNTFDQYIELRYFSGGWSAYLPDGRKFDFGRAEVSTRMPNNNRSIGYGTLERYLENDTTIQDPRQSILAQLEQKVTTFSWHCTTISDKLHFPGQNINFEYKGYGAFDPYQELRQPNYSKWLYFEIKGQGEADWDQESGFSDPNMDMGPPVTYARDLFLDRITAYGPEGELDRLTLEYGEFDARPGGETPVDLITDHAFDPAIDLDPLYAGHEVCAYGGAEDEFADWRRFAHLKSDVIPNGSAAHPSSTDPYASGDGHRYAVELSDATQLAFDHGVLESPRLCANERLFPGDMYEVRTTVQGPSGTDRKAANIDLRLFTSDADHAQGGPSGAGWMDDQDYRAGRDIPIFDTFDRAVKWNTCGVSTSGLVETSNFFMMPALQQLPGTGERGHIRGFNLQIGPANSDNDFSMGYTGSLVDLKFAPMIFHDAYDLYDPASGQSEPKYVSAYGTYIHFKNAFAQYAPASPQCRLGFPGNGLLAYQDMPHNFGVGLPWSMLINTGNRLATGAALMGRPWESPVFDFWWEDEASYGSDDLQPRSNIPTLLNGNAKLKKVQVVRYSKRPLLLQAVHHHVRNGEVTDGDDADMRLAATTLVEHACHRREILVRTGYGTDDAPQFSGFVKNEFPIAAFRVAPVDPSTGGLADPSGIDERTMPTTRLEYEGMDAFNDAANDPPSYDCRTTPPPTEELLAFLWNKAQLLSAIVDPLGGRTEVVYNDLRDQVLADIKLLAVGKVNTFEHDTTHCHDTHRVDGYAFAITPTVKELHRSGESASDVRVTSYTYADKVQRPRIFALTPNYRGADGPHSEPDKGFLHVTVRGPDNAGVRSRTEYLFRGGMFFDIVTVDDGEGAPWTGLGDPIWPDENDPQAQEFLLFGKLARVQQYDQVDHLVVQDSTSYAAVKAFDNGINRPSFNTQGINERACDYIDYEDGFMQPPLEANSGLRNTRDPLENDAFLELQGYLAVDPPTDPTHYFTPQFNIDAWMPDIYLNSYFIRKDRGSHKEFDPAGCRKGEPLPVLPPFREPIGEVSNTATGWHNTAHNAHGTTLISGITANGLTLMESTLIANSPLQESVLAEVVGAATMGYGPSLERILLAQPALTEDRLVQLMGKPGTVLPSRIDTVLLVQPQLTDTVLRAAARSEMTRPAYKKLLLRQDRLSSVVMDSIIATNALAATDLLDVLLAQPELPGPIVLQLLASDAMSAHLKASLLTAGPGLTYAAMMAVLDIGPHWDLNAARDVLIHGKTYPTDSILLVLLADTLYPDDWLIDVLRASPRALGSAVRTAVEGRDAVKEGVEDMADWEDLVTDCSTCVPTNLVIENITDYAYYEAAPNGITDALGYKRLFGFPDNEPPFQLKWNPSWMVFSTKKWSPQAPGTYTRDEYYYYQDLLNRYDRHWSVLRRAEGSNLPTVTALTYDEEDPERDPETGLQFWQVMQGGDMYRVPDIAPLPFMQQFRNRTAAIYQHRTVTQGPNDDEPFSTNAFYYYFQSWPTLPDGPEETVEETDPRPCPPPLSSSGSGGSGGATGGSAGPPNDGYYQLADFRGGDDDACSRTPSGWAMVRQVATGSYFCVTIAEAESMTESDTAYVFICKNDPHDPENELRMRPFRDVVKKAFQLRSVHVQVEPEVHPIENAFITDGAVPLMQFHKEVGPYDDDHFYYPPSIPYEVIDKRVVLERNAYQQVALEENERGARTKYAFPQSTRIWHVYPGRDCANWTNFSTYHPLLPDGIITGYGLDCNTEECPIGVGYTYNLDNSVNGVTDFNGLHTYKYDAFGRLQRTYRSNELIGTNTYSYWDGDTSDAFAARARQNYVESIQYLESGSHEALRTRAYVDPLGRPYNTIAAIGTIADPDAPPTDVTGLVSSGKATYDTWDRTTMAYRPFEYHLNPSNDPFPFAINSTILAAAPTTGNASAIEKDFRDRPLFTAKPGESIGSANPHRVKYRYHFMNGGAFACALGLSASEAHALMPAAPDATTWRMAEVEDEDGRITREYTDPFGRKVATQGYIDARTDAVTLFFHDGRGLLTRVSDPEKHTTRYRYNHLGWTTHRITADGGVTKYMYDKSGNVVLEQDATAAQGEQVEGTDATVPTYRRYVYDRLGRLVRQERVRLYVPNRGEWTTFKLKPQLGADVGITVSSHPVDVLLYADHDPGEGNLVDIDSELGGASAYAFSDRSSLDWLSVQRVCAWNYGEPSLYVEENGDRGEIEVLNASLVGDPLVEKAWSYDRDRGLVAPYPIQAALDQPDRCRARLACTIAHPHVRYQSLPSGSLGPTTFVRGRGAAVPPPVQQDQFGYDEAGRIRWQLQQFNPNGIRLGARGVLTLLDNAAYDLRGDLRTCNIDVNADGVLDLQHTYTYDAWGRLTDVHAGHQDAGTANPKVAHFAYDPATGLPTTTTYYHRCATSTTDSPVETITYTHDVRDRLRGIAGRFFQEELFYDGNYVHIGTVWPVSQRNWNGGINSTAATYTLASAGNAPADGFDATTSLGYTYDGLGRLLQADGVLGDAVVGLTDANDLRFRVGDERMAYDRIGNVQQLTRWGWFGDDAVNVRNEGWDYRYATGRSRLLALQPLAGSWNDPRTYTYNACGDLVRDDFRTYENDRIGRAHLPYHALVQNGAQMRGLHYFYDVSDRRTYKQESEGREVSAVLGSAYYLRDAGGRELGVLDLEAGTWTWYLYGGQRFAHLEPRPEQQPSFHSERIGHAGMLTGTGAEYNALLACLAGLAPVTYPLRIWEVVLVDGTVVFLSDADYLDLDPAEVASAKSIDFATADATLYVHPDGGDPVKLSIGALLNTAVGGDDGAPGQLELPWTWAAPADDDVNDLTFYDLDHLGNTRVTYRPEVKCQGTGVQYKLQHVVDYYPYGKVLRQFIETDGREKYLSTQHERDKETELDYREARYYDSDVARFLSMDPLAADYTSWSTYNYVMGNPIGLTDPTGRYVTRYEDENGKYLGDDGVDNGITMQVTEAKWNEVNSDQANLTNGRLNTAGRSRLALDGRITNSPVMRALKAQQQSDPTNKVVGDGMMAIGVLTANDATGIGVADDVLIPFIVFAEDVYIISNMMNEMSGRASNKRKPDPGASGDHTVIDGNGSTTYTRNGMNPTGWDEKKRVDVKGRSHRNPDGTEVPTPHVKEAGTKSVRSACKGMDY